MRKNIVFMTLLALIAFAGCGSVSLFEKGNAARETNKVKARGYYEEACEKENHFEACHNAAVLWQNGDGISEENKKARELFKKACDGKFDESCFILADMWANGKGGVYKDTDSAFNLYKETCERGLGKACRGVGQIYAKGGGSIAKDVNKAKEYFELACNKGDMKTCVDLGQTWSKKFEEEEGYSKVVTFWGKACQEGGMLDICEKLADMIVSTKEKEEKVPLSKPYFEKACDGGSKEACYKLARAMVENVEGVALGTQDVETAQSFHFLVVGFPLVVGFFQRSLEFFLSGFCSAEFSCKCFR